MVHQEGFLQLVNSVRADIQETNVETVKKRMDAGDKFTLIDVREDSEWVGGHIPGALHLCKGIIERDIEQAIPDKQQPLVLYCGGGYRSALAAYNIQRMGYQNVISMDGGMRGWREARYPIED